MATNQNSTALTTHDWHGIISSFTMNNTIYKDENETISFTLEPTSFTPTTGWSLQPSSSGQNFRFLLESSDGTINKTINKTIDCTVYTYSGNQPCDDNVNIAIHRYVYVPNAINNLTDIIDTSAFSNYDSSINFNLSVRKGSSSGGCQFEPINNDLYSPPTTVSNVTVNPIVTVTGISASGSDKDVCIGTTTEGNINTSCTITTSGKGYVLVGAYEYNSSGLISTLISTYYEFINGSKSLSDTFTYTGMTNDNVYGMKWRAGETGNDVVYSYPLVGNVTVPSTPTMGSSNVSQGTNVGNVSWNNYTFGSIDPALHGYTYHQQYNINSGSWINYDTNSSTSVSFSGISATINARSILSSSTCSDIIGTTASNVVWKTPEITNITQVDCGTTATISVSWADSVSINGTPYSITLDGSGNGTYDFTPISGTTYTIIPSNGGLTGQSETYTCASCQNTSNVTTSINGVGVVSVSWNSVNNADSYKVYRKLSTSSTWTLLNTTTSLSITDSPSLPHVQPNNLSDSNFDYTCASGTIDTNVNLAISDVNYIYDYKVTTICNSTETTGTTDSITISSTPAEKGVAYRHCDISDYHINSTNLTNASINFDNDGIINMQANHVYGVASYVKDNYNNYNYGTWYYFSDTLHSEKLVGEVGDSRARITGTALQTNGDLTIDYVLEYNDNGTWRNLYGHEDDYLLGNGSDAFHHISVYFTTSTGIRISEVNYFPEPFQASYNHIIGSSFLSGFEGENIYTQFHVYNKYIDCLSDFITPSTYKVPSDLSSDNINITLNGFTTTQQNVFCEEEYNPFVLRMNGSISGTSTDLTNGQTYYVGFKLQYANNNYVDHIITASGEIYNNGISFTFDDTYNIPAISDNMDMTITPKIYHNIGPGLYSADITFSDKITNYYIKQIVNPNITNAEYDNTIDKISVSGNITGSSSPLYNISSYTKYAYVSYDNGASWTNKTISSWNISGINFTFDLLNITTQPDKIKLNFNLSSPCNSIKTDIADITSLYEPTIGSFVITSPSPAYVCPDGTLSVSSTISNYVSGLYIRYYFYKNNSGTLIEKTFSQFALSGSSHNTNFTLGTGNFVFTSTTDGDDIYRITARLYDSNDNELDSDIFGFTVKHTTSWLSSTTYTLLGNKYIDEINTVDNIFQYNIKKFDTLNMKLGATTIYSTTDSLITSFKPSQIKNYIQSNTTFTKNTDLQLDINVNICGINTLIDSKTIYYFPECSYVSLFQANEVSDNGTIKTVDITFDTSSQIDDDTNITKTGTLKRIVDGVETILTTFTFTTISGSESHTYTDNFDYSGLTAGQYDIEYILNYQYVSNHTGVNRTVNPKTNTVSDTVPLLLSDINLYTEIYSPTDVLLDTTSSIKNYIPDSTIGYVKVYWKVNSPIAGYRYQFILRHWTDCSTSTDYEQFDIVNFDDGSGGYYIHQYDMTDFDTLTSFPLVARIDEYDNLNVGTGQGARNIFYFPLGHLELESDKATVDLEETFTLSTVLDSSWFNSSTVYGDIKLQRRLKGNTTWSDVNSYPYPTTTTVNTVCRPFSMSETQVLHDYGVYEYRLYSNDPNKVEGNIIEVRVRNPYSPTNQII